MRILITSALPYINGIKHLGNLAGSMLPADVHARFHRLQGAEVLFICATDEHGTPAELAAAAQGMSVRAYCDEQHALQKQIYQAFGLSFDWFGRTSSSHNAALTQHFATALERRGYIEERVTRQVYSVDDGRFLPDRYVEGTCPHCGYPDARGDQCDNCGSLLDPTDLIEPRSKISGSTRLEQRATAHLFLLQDRLQPDIDAWVSQAAGWPQLARSIARKWLDEGLQARSITRDLSWGVPVVDTAGQPRAGFDQKVYYVWFDAPIGYVSATQEWAAAGGGDWQRWWLTDRGAHDVEYVQFMGKDNVAFHTVSFPATVIGSGEPWKLVDRLKAFNWFNWYGQKFSTSRRRGVFMDAAIALLPADYWRWYLMANAPEGNDVVFTWEGFQSAINADLCNTLGNFVNRIQQFCKTRFDGLVPATGTPGPLEAELERDLNGRLENLTRLHEQIELRKAAAETKAIWSLGNEYLAQAAPWTAIKTDVDRAAVIVRTALNLCTLFAHIAAPFVPDAARRILASFGEEPRHGAWPWPGPQGLLDRLPAGSPVNPGDVLFGRIEDSWVAQQKTAFGGDDSAPGAQTD
jgi:methionyl-tRNA synthetase